MERRKKSMKLKLALILYIILTLAFLVFSEIKQSKSLASLEAKFEDMEFVYESK